MKAWIISDTHNKHWLLNVPENIDMVIHAGDSSAQKSPAINSNEVLDFFDWYKALPIKHKIFVPGNHDTSIEHGLITRGDVPNGITFLEHESVEIEGLKFFGSPYTPQFGTGWAYNVPRESIKPYWDDIPKDTDVLITHGPPKGILDLTQYDSRAGANGKSFFQCGCKELLEVVKEIQPKFHIFGHIHTEPQCPNSGILQVQNCKTTFINAAVCEFSTNVDNSFVINNGFIIEI